MLQTVEKVIFYKLPILIFMWYFAVDAEIEIENL